MLLDLGTNAQTKATHEQRRGNDVTDVYTRTVGGFAATLDSVDIARLKADPSVMSIQPDLRVSIDAVPANDMFANATVVSASSGSKTGSTVDATREDREPKPINPWGNRGKWIWCSWTAPVTGSLSLDTRSSSYDTLIAISIGSAISALTNVGEDVDRHRVGGHDARAELARLGPAADGSAREQAQRLSAELTPIDRRLNAWRGIEVGRRPGRGLAPEPPGI